MTEVTGASASLCYTTRDAIATVCSSRGGPRWTSFISAFPARRFVQRKSKVNVSGVEAPDVCPSV
jgi:hypothetical protein